MSPCSRLRLGLVFRAASSDCTAAVRSVTAAYLLSRSASSDRRARASSDSALKPAMPAGCKSH